MTPYVTSLSFSNLMITIAVGCMVMALIVGLKK